MRTDETWTRRIHALDELPERFQSHLPSGETPISVLYTPYLDSLWGDRAERIIALYSDHLRILRDHRDREAEAVRLAYADIRSLEYGQILLQSWITLRRGAADDDITLEFSAAVESLFRPIIERFRYLQSGVAEPAGRRERSWNADLEFLLKTNFKFYNYANMNVPPDVTVRGVLYEAALRRRLAAVIHIVRIPTQILVLTDTELIRITEEKPHAELFRLRTSYGAITTFVPRRHIVGAEIVPGGEPDILHLRVTLDSGHLLWPFASTEEPSLRTLARLIGSERAAA